MLTKKEIKQTQYGISLYYLFAMMAISVATTLLPIYMRTLNFSSTQIGIIVGFGPFISIFLTPLWGIFSDKFKKVNKIIFYILLGLMLSAILLGLSKTFITYIASFMLYNALLCGVGPLVDEIAIEVESRFNIPFNVMRLFGSIGYATALVPVIYVVDRLNNYTVAFIGLFVFFACASISTFLFKPMDKIKIQKENTKNEKLSTAIVSLIKNHPYILLVIIAAIINSANEIMGSFQGIHMVETLGSPSYAISLSVFISAFVSEVPMMYIAPKIHKKIGWINCLLVSATVFLIRFGLESFTSSWIIFLAIRLLNGPTIAMLLSPLLMILKENVSDNIYASAMTFMLSFKALCSFILSIAIGSINDIIGTTFGMYYIVVPLIILAIILILIFRKKYDKNLVAN